MGHLGPSSYIYIDTFEEKFQLFFSGGKDYLKRASGSIAPPGLVSIFGSGVWSGLVSAGLLETDCWPDWFESLVIVLIGLTSSESIIVCQFLRTLCPKGICLPYLSMNSFKSVKVLTMFNSVR